MKKQLSRNVIIREILTAIAGGFIGGTISSLTGICDETFMLAAATGMIATTFAALLRITFFPQWVRE